jgi:PII-like signaling protein
VQRQREISDLDGALVTIAVVGFISDQLFHWSSTFILRRYLAVA